MSTLDGSIAAQGFAAHSIKKSENTISKFSVILVTMNPQFAEFLDPWERVRRAIAHPLSAGSMMTEEETLEEIKTMFQTPENLIKVATAQWHLHPRRGQYIERRKKLLQSRDTYLGELAKYHVPVEGGPAFVEKNRRKKNEKQAVVSAYDQWKREREAMNDWYEAQEEDEESEYYGLTNEYWKDMANVVDAYFD